MLKAKAKMPAIGRIEGKKALAIAAAIAIVILIALLCISINMRSHIQDEYTTVKNQIGESLYSNMYMMMQTFDMASVPNADVQNVVIPQMKNYFIASTTLNDLLTNTFGQKYTVMSSEQISVIEKAFSAYEKAFESNSSTDLAYSDMQSCMEMVRDLLTSRFSEGALKPLR